MKLTSEQIKIITKILCEHKEDTEIKLKKVLEKKQKDKTALMFIDICRDQIEECNQALECLFNSLKVIPKEETKILEIIYKVILTKIIISEYTVLNYNCTRENRKNFSQVEKRNCIAILKQIKLFSGGNEYV